MVGRGGRARRTRAFLVNDNLPIGGTSEDSYKVFNPHVRVGIECSAVLLRIDWRAHWFNVVADDEDRAAWRYRTEKVVGGTIIWCPRYRGVLR